MTIADAQIEAAAEAIWDSYRSYAPDEFPIGREVSWAELSRYAAEPGAAKSIVDGHAQCRAFARAALEAAEVAAWSSDMEAAPDYEEVLLHVPPFAPMQGTRSGRFKTWMVGARSIIGRDLGPDNSPRMWRPLPTPPTKEGK